MTLLQNWQGHDMPYHRAGNEPLNHAMAQLFTIFEIYDGEAEAVDSFAYKKVCVVSASDGVRVVFGFRCSFTFFRNPVGESSDG